MKAQRLFPLVVIAAGLLAYQNSFTGAFLQDDFASIVENRTIRHLWPISRCLSPPHADGLTVEGRPLINLSLAINYNLAGLRVWGYHALNLTVHILAGLSLLGIVRRTLLQPALRDRFGAAADELGLAVAVLWTVHPLQTESVTYIIQRAESIMGLLYLLTLYCFIRGAGAPLGARSPRDEVRSRLWYGLSATTCALGMASKEVMVSAPVMVMLYDRAFISVSFREAWRRRWLLYLALTSTWILLGLVLVLGGNITTALKNAQHYGVTRWEYLRTEPGVILYYMRLSVWPAPLRLLHHGWPIAKTWMSIVPPAVAVGILVGASALAWRKNPVWGFVGAWFFLILAPSSSVIPLFDPLCDHRMYLPLAAVVSLVVVGLYSLAGKPCLIVFVALAVSLGFLTWRRNSDYRSEIAMEYSGVAERPNDPLAHYSLAMALQKAGRIQEAISHYEQVLRRNPNIEEVHYNFGLALFEAGKFEDAIRQYAEALRINPDIAEAHQNWGLALVRLNRLPEAIAHWEQAVRINPGYAEAHNNLGSALTRLGRQQEAIAHWERALRLKPNYALAHDNLAVALVGLGRLPEAVEHFTEAVRINPGYAEAHYNLGLALSRLGSQQEAMRHWEQALQIKPDFAEAHYNLGVALEQAGRVEEAIGHYQQALRLKPDFTEAQMALAKLRAVQ